MKATFLLILLASTLVACGKDITTVGEQPVALDIQEPYDENEMETDAHVLGSGEGEDFMSQFLAKIHSFKFAQTSWDECYDKITGNYSKANCSRNRKISLMLKNFMGEHMHKCVDAGLAAQGGGRVERFHIVHAGIFGDPNHSPRSLHAENRAIDIKSLVVKTTSGTTREFVFSGQTNRAFYTAFRRCWGNVVHTNNGCPFVSGGTIQTGSIGWENKDHQHHLHTSIPYCVGKKYGAYYYQR